MKRARRALGMIALVLYFAHHPASAVAQSGGISGPSLTGRVLSKTSRPVRNVWVIVYAGATLKGRSLTGDDGRYYVARLENRKYTIVVRKGLKSNNIFSSVVSVPVKGAYDIKLPQ